MAFFLNGTAGADTVAELADATGRRPMTSSLGGTPGDDLVIAQNFWTPIITALGGNDTVESFDGILTVDGGTGNDYLLAHSSNTTLIGGEGNDRLEGGRAQYGGAGNDVLNGKWDAVYVDGGDGDDVVVSGMTGSAMFPTTVLGGAGNDTLQGARGDQLIDGGDGVDTLVFLPDYNDDVGNFADYVITYDAATASFAITFAIATWGNPGRDTVSNVELFKFVDGTRTTASLAAMFGSAAGDLFTGTDGADEFHGLGGDDAISGLGGDDTLEGGAGNDVMDGGDGIDTITYSRESAGVTVDLALTGPQQTGPAGIDTLSHFEVLMGSNYDDRLAGDTGANRIEGGRGNDTLDGGGGGDTLVGGAGSDTYIVRHSGDVLVEVLVTWDDPDYVFAWADYALAPLLQDLTLMGTASLRGEGNDLDNVITGNAGDNVLLGLGGNDTILGMAGDDYIVGGAGYASYGGLGRLAGGAGADTVVGGARGGSLFSGDAGSSRDSIASFIDRGMEHDVLIGGAADDRFFAGMGDDVDGAGFEGSSGNDLSVSYRTSDHGVTADFRGLASGQGVVIEGGLIQNIQRVGWLEGTEFDDLLAPFTAGSVGGEIFGFGGNDRIIGGTQAHWIEGGDGNDTIESAIVDGVPQIAGGNGDDTITAISGRIDGGSGNDTMTVTGTGTQMSGTTVTGATGNDTITGGWRTYGEDGDDVLRALEVTSLLDGGNGNDRLVGAQLAPIDRPYPLVVTMMGGAGDDTFEGGSANDVFDGGSGVDTLVLTNRAADYGISWNAATQELSFLDREHYFEHRDVARGIEWFAFRDGTFSAAQLVAQLGTAGTDNYAGTAGNDRFSGGDGDDTILGGAGNDTLEGGFGNDLLDGGSGIDTISFANSSGVSVRLGRTTAQATYMGTDFVLNFENVIGSRNSDSIIGDDNPNVLDGGAGTDVLNGGGGDDTLIGGAELDFIQGGAGNDTLIDLDAADFDGGDGIDVVLSPGARAAHSIHRLNGNLFIDNSRLVSVERLQFDDASVALDIAGNAGQAYRLYQAAFDRVPDLGGVGFQMRMLDIGFRLTDIAANFVESPEFQSKYGAVNNTQFITLLYRNVLHRDPDAGGLEFHKTNLDAGLTRNYLLAQFSESPENQANVIGAIQDGIVFIPS